MQRFTGSLRLIRLALRRDRVKLPAWILALTAVVSANVPAVTELYGKNTESQVEYASTIAPSLINRIFGGPLLGANIGEIVINETFLFTGLAVAFMSVLAVVRHTRQNEETGRSELIGSAVVGRHASLFAALVVAVLANVALAVLLGASLTANGLPAGGAFGMAAALGAIGLAFAAVAAVTAQISESARGANSMAAMIIGVSFMLRTLGDSMGQLTADRLGVLSAWPSWLSPLGWGQQIHPFTTANWWVFGIYAGFFMLAVWLAFYLNARRDVGSGLLQTRKGPAVAPKSLHSAWGLACRLQRGVLIGWAVGIAFLGSTLGLISKEFAKMFEENPDLQAYLSGLGGSGAFTDVFFAAMIAISALCISGYVIQALQRMRSEESNGTLEPVLATGVSRQRWMLSHLCFALLGATLLLVLLGATAGLSNVLVANGAWTDVTTLTGAALAQLPAVAVIGGITVLCFGAVPRATIAASWSIFGACLLIGQFGEVLKLPNWVVNMSPFTHIPAAPAENLVFAPLAITATTAILCMAVGMLLFRQRNIVTG
jgi:ABC-2 type transport system permease protein